MYYEETIINDMLHFRTSPKGVWMSMSYPELSAKVIELRKQLEAVRKHRDTLLDAESNRKEEALLINKYTTLGEITTFLTRE